MAVVLNNKYENQSICRAHLDLELLNRCDESDLDVDVLLHEGGIALRKLTIWEKIINWFVCGSTNARLERLAGYVGQAANRYLARNMGLSQDELRKFYQGLRKWEHIEQTPIKQRLVKSMDSDKTKAKTSYQQACREFLAAREGLDAAYRVQNPDQIRAATTLFQRKKSNMNRYLWKWKKAEVDYAKEKGIDWVKLGGGVTGTKAGRDCDERTLMVIKTNSKDPRFINERWIPRHRSQEQVCSNDPRQAEAVAFAASDFFNFDVVPPTYTDENGYSMQLYEDDGVEAHKTSVKTWSNYSSEDLERLQLMAVFNYLIGDLDGKDDSWKMILEQGRLIDIVKFDNANSFPEYPLERLRDWLTLRKTYAWKNHRWAQERLNPIPGSRLDRALKRLCNQQNLNDFMLMINETYPGFFTGNRINLFMDRVGLIKAVREMKLPLSELGDIYGREHFERNPSIIGAILQQRQENWFAAQEPAEEFEALNPQGPEVEEEQNDLPVVHPDARAVANMPEALPPAFVPPQPDVEISKPTLTQQAWGWASWMATPVARPLAWARDTAVDGIGRMIPNISFI